MEDVINKIKTLKDQVKQVSEDQNQISDILRAIAEKQVKNMNLRFFIISTFQCKYDYTIIINKFRAFP